MVRNSIGYVADTSLKGRGDHIMNVHAPYEE
jgi:hypothetical protein